ncbi:MAG TPA: HEAT repeat domain-containing protein [Polyangiaceae bacterium]|nr:HEAT repeat domain-containing protein [Polyangiaceae bacterium]
MMALAVLSVSLEASAQDASVERMIQNLRDRDFRVRTQAALALGTSKSAKAVSPLCGALSDQNASVRTAAAAALGRLAKGGSDCLERKLRSERSATVRAAITNSLDLILAAAEPVFTESTRYYIAIAKLTDRTGRPEGELDRRVRRAMMSAGADLGTFAFAPLNETPAQGKQRMRKHASLRGFYLMPRLPAFEYSASGLTVKLEVAMFSYPERSLIGSYSVRLTQPDVEGRDPESENELVAMAAERALEKFAKLAANL